MELDLATVQVVAVDEATLIVSEVAIKVDVALTGERSTQGVEVPVPKGAER